MPRLSQAVSDVRTARTLLIIAVCALVVIGLLMVYSASYANLINEESSASSEAVSQVVYALVGIVGALILWKVLPYRVWQGPLVWVVWGVSLALLVLTLVMGSTDYGAQRWLRLGPVGLQPSEFAKVAFLLMAVRIMYQYRAGDIELRAALVQAVLFVLIPLAFMYRSQSDLGTTLICAVGVLAVMWLGGVSSRILGVILGAGVIFVLFAIFGTGYRSDRLVYLDPWNDGEDGYGAGYNIIRSYYALAEGGIFGVGLGNGHEKFQYLFASESDFIFAVIGEELGMVGALLVIGLFLVVLVMGLRIATAAADEYGAMMAGGFTIMLVFQAFLNIGCAIGVFPTTGKPLPFISAGGTSLVISLAMIGFILSVSESAAEPNVYERRRADLRIIRADRGDEAPARRSSGLSERTRTRALRSEFSSRRADYPSARIVRFESPRGSRR